MQTDTTTPPKRAQSNSLVILDTATQHICHAEPSAATTGGRSHNQFRQTVKHLMFVCDARIKPMCLLSGQLSTRGMECRKFSGLGREGGTLSFTEFYMDVKTTHVPLTDHHIPKIG